MMMALMADHPEFLPQPLPELSTPEHELDYLTNFERKYRIEALTADLPGVVPIAGRHLTPSIEDLGWLCWSEDAGSRPRLRITVPEAGCVARRRRYSRRAATCFDAPTSIWLPASSFRSRKPRLLLDSALSHSLRTGRSNHGRLFRCFREIRAAGRFEPYNGVPEDSKRSVVVGTGAPVMLVNILGITDDAKCYGLVRQLRWPEGVRCPHCDSDQIVKQGRDDTRPQRQRYECRACNRRFDDLTDTIFAGHHQPLRAWILVLYFLGLNLSNEQVAEELDLDPDDVQRMATLLREGIVQRKPEVKLSGEVECDEVYVVAGHKGHPEAVRKKGETDAAGG